MARGLFRLWVVLSIMWAIPVYLWVSSIGPIATALILSVGAPMVVLAIGSGLVWAGRGFKS